jgi:hypothetical protein
VENSIIILKARFKSNSLSLYGLLLVIFNKNQDIDNFNTVVSTYSSVYDNEPHLGWDSYEERILEIKWKGTFNNSMTSSLMNQISALAKDPNQKNQLYEYLNNYDYDSVETLIYDTVNRIIHDKNLILEVGIQEVTPEEFRETKENRGKAQEKPAAADASVEDGSAILPVEPILSPVKGKPIYELKIGDKIMARIIPNSDRANYFIDLMNLRTENTIRPIPCEVIDIKSTGKNAPIDILMMIGPGIYGKCSEEEKQVKLKIYDPASDGPPVKANVAKKAMTQASSATSEPGIGFSRSTYLVIGLFALILVIFILLIYISFM